MGGNEKPISSHHTMVITVVCYLVSLLNSLVHLFVDMAEDRVLKWLPKTEYYYLVK